MANQNNSNGIVSLVENGAHLHGIDKRGKSALHWAIEGGALQAAVLLLEQVQGPPATWGHAMHYTMA